MPKKQKQKNWDEKEKAVTVISYCAGILGCWVTTWLWANPNNNNTHGSLTVAERLNASLQKRHSDISLWQRSAQLNKTGLLTAQDHNI